LRPASKRPEIPRAMGRTRPGRSPRGSRRCEGCREVRSRTISSGLTQIPFASWSANGGFRAVLFALSKPSPALWRSSSGVPQLQWGEMKPTVIRLWSWKNGPVLVEAGAAKKSACRVHSPQSLISSIGNPASKKAQSRPNNQE
jgi:hypothetical protein